MSESPDVNAAVERIEALLGELGGSKQAEELVRVLMQVYGAGLARIVELLEKAEVERLSRDKLVASLLLIHNLHPLDPETRIREALAPVERRLDGQHVIFDGIVDGVARIRIDANGSGGVPPGLAAAIERAAAEAAPDLEGVKVEVPSRLVQIDGIIA
jgi:hypothetical protein